MGVCKRCSVDDQDQLFCPQCEETLRGSIGAKLNRLMEDTTYWTRDEWYLIYDLEAKVSVKTEFQDSLSPPEPIKDTYQCQCGKCGAVSSYGKTGYKSPKSCLTCGKTLDKEVSYCSIDCRRDSLDCEM